MVSDLYYVDSVRIMTGVTEIDYKESLYIVRFLVQTTRILDQRY